MTYEVTEGPQLAFLNYAQCSHSVVYRNGHNRHRQRLVCAFCGKDFVEGSVSHEVKRLLVGRQLVKGLTLRQAAEAAGVSVSLAFRVNRLMKRYKRGGDGMKGNKQNDMTTMEPMRKR